MCHDTQYQGRFVIVPIEEQTGLYAAYIKDTTSGDIVAYFDSYAWAQEVWYLLTGAEPE